MNEKHSSATPRRADSETDSAVGVGSPTAGHAKPTLLLISGLSGSGKSTAANALEDIGFYCVDNLPLPLLRTFLNDPGAQVGGRQQVAVVADVRAPGFAEVMPDLLSEIDRRHFDFALVFLDASDEALLRRYSETRRLHPMGDGDRPVIEGIRRERSLLCELRGQADLLIDTSEWSVHDVRRQIYDAFADPKARDSAMVVSMISFGFKHGVPSGIDLLFDVRFLGNPYFVSNLRDQSGLDAGVQDFLESQSAFQKFIEKSSDLLQFMLPQYLRENRRYLSIAIGCTGGRHRSVATCERLARLLAEGGWEIRLNHRDLDR